MKVNNQLTLQRLIGKVDNDFNISESDWIPRAAAWTIDALSQLKVLPMVKKRRRLEVCNKIAIFPCTITAHELRVYDSNGIEVKSYQAEKDCRKCPPAFPSTGEQIAITNPNAKQGFESMEVADIVPTSNRNYVLDGNRIELNFNTPWIEVESYEVATYHDDYYNCECPYIYDDGLLLEALSWYILFKYLSRGSKHPIYDLKSNSPVTNPYLQWTNLKAKAAASVKNKLYDATDGWNNFFYNSTILPRS